MARKMNSLKFRKNKNKKYIKTIMQPYFICMRKMSIKMQ